jgi:LysR family hydrogen peroxide-inducible transcriptional activator
MTLTQLEYLLAVATYKSFVAAAEKCFVTQPTMSMQIQKLEDELGVKLFDRSSQPISLTAIGELVVKQAQVVLSESQKVIDLVQNQQHQVAGRVKFGIIPTLAPYIIPDLLQRISIEIPDVFLEIFEMETEDIVSGLRKGELDMAMISTPYDHVDIKEYPFFYETFVAYFTPQAPQLAHKLIEVTHLNLEDIWLLSEGNCMRNQVLDLCSDYIHQLQAEKAYKYETSNVETLCKMVDTLGGFTIIPELATIGLSEDRLDRVRYFNSPEPVREISLVTSQHFAKVTVLNALKSLISQMIPKKMLASKDGRRILRIQSAKL